MTTLLEFRDQGRQDYNGKTLLKWGPEDREKVAADFNFRRGNTNSPDYDVKATLNVLDLDPLAVRGTILLNPTKSLVDLNWSRGSMQYKLHLQHGPIEDGLESGALAILKVDKVEYKGVVVYRLDEVMKAVKVDIDYGKKISTYFKVWLVIVSFDGLQMYTSLHFSTKWT